MRDGTDGWVVCCDLIVASMKSMNCIRAHFIVGWEEVNGLLALVLFDDPLEFVCMGKGLSFLTG